MKIINNFGNKNRIDFSQKLWKTEFVFGFYWFSISSSLMLAQQKPKIYLKSFL